MTESTFKLGPNQERWLAALESGEYRQCKGRLHSKRGYCCLGIADLVLSLGEKHRKLLRHTFRDVGLYDEDGRFVSGEGVVGSFFAVSLADANDSGGTFAEIAAFIRANPELVFMESK